MSMIVKLAFTLSFVMIIGCAGTQRYECDAGDQEKLAEFTLQCFKESDGGTSVGQCASAAIRVYCTKELSN